jgi:hypothetical protein
MPSSDAAAGPGRARPGSRRGSSDAGRGERLLGRATLVATGAAIATALLLLVTPVGLAVHAALLTHVGLGLLALPLAVAYTALHLLRLWSRDRGASRNVALGATATLLGAFATGALLAFFYASGSAAPSLRSLHWVLGGSIAVLLPVHVVTTMARQSTKLRVMRPGALAAGSVGLPLAVGAAVALAIAPPSPRVPVPADYPRSPDGSLFGASFTETASGEFVGLRWLTGSEACGGCHDEIAREWAASVHRFSGLDNELIAAATRPAESGGGLPASRFCAACHEPVPLLAGQVVTSVFEVPESHLEHGVTCLVCHGVQSVPGLQGNGQMVYATPDVFPLFNTGSAAGDALHRLLVHSAPEAHRRAMRPPIMSNSQQCSSCHTVNAHEGLNGFGFARLHNENDDWGVSAFAEGVGEPPEVVRCQDCHMGRVEGSHDPVARRNGGTHRSHRFLAANTFVARHLGDEVQMRETERFLRGEAFPEEIRHLLPEGPPIALDLEVPGAVHPGERLALSVVLTNRSVGHAFPAGPSEVHEAWVDLVVTDAEGRTLLHSGALDEEGARDPDAFALVSIPVDAKGNEIFGTAGLSAGFRNRRSILHGESDRASWEVALPAELAGPLRVRARLRYRKADAQFIPLMEGFHIDDVPITDVVAAEARVRVLPAREPVARYSSRR